MKTVNIRTADSSLSKIVRDVAENGETYTITVGRIPRAMVVPVPDPGAEVAK